MNFTVYKNNTGQIVRCGSTIGDIYIQAQTGETVVEGYYSSNEYYFQNNVPKKIPSKPSDFHFFDYEKLEWVFNKENAFFTIRQKRDKLLYESDWTQLPDAPTKNKEAWAAYRQALRDVTLQPDPVKIDWPTKPE